MKKIAVAVLALVLVFGIAGTAAAKKMYLINFDKGGMPNDSNGCEFSLSEEKAPKGQIYLKISPTKDSKPGEMWCGEFGPKKANWDGYDVIKFDYFNEAKGPQALCFIIKPAGSDYNTRLDANFVARPGKGSVEIEIAGACGNGGAPIDWKTPVKQWNIGGVSGPIHIGNITLETNEDEKDTKKEEKKK